MKDCKTRRGQNTAGTPTGLRHCPLAAIGQPTPMTCHVEARWPETLRLNPPEVSEHQRRNYSRYPSLAQNSMKPGLLDGGSFHLIPPPPARVRRQCLGEKRIEQAATRCRRRWRGSPPAGRRAPSAHRTLATMRCCSARMWNALSRLVNCEIDLPDARHGLN